MTTEQHVLIVEDEPKIAQLLIDYFQANHFKTTWIDNGTDVVDWVRNNTVDIVLLDLMLPGKDGIKICQELREFTQLPIMMITAKVEEIDRILGIEIGADDYICKPFSPREVITRVKALLRRANFASQVSTQPSKLQLEPEKFEVKLYDQPVELTPVEFKLLDALAEKPGIVFSRQKLMEHVYDDHRIVSDRTMDTHIKNLRKKLQEAGGDADIIRSIYGVGYKFDNSSLT